MQLFENEQSLISSGYIFRILDVGPRCLDRITVIFCDGDYLSLSETGAGFSQWGSNLDVSGIPETIDNHQQVELTFGDLRPELRKHILYRVNEAYADILKETDRRSPSSVAPRRELANPIDDYLNNCGSSIYSAGNMFCIRVSDDDAQHDRGPYQTARETIINTLPDAHSYSAPEYHPEINPNTLNKSEDRAKRIKALQISDLTI